MKPVTSKARLFSPKEVWQQRKPDTGARCGGLGDVVAAAERKTGTWKLPRQPERLRKMRIDLIEAYKDRVLTLFDTATIGSRSIEAEPQDRQRACNDVAILWATKTQGYIRLTPL